MMVRAIRGAVQAPRNSAEAIRSVTRELVAEVMERNGLEPAQLISVLFTTSPDLNAGFPAAAARELGLDQVPLMCASEIDVPDAVPRVVRLLAHVQLPPRSDVTHVYLGGAAALRPDLADGPHGAKGTAVIVGSGLMGTSLGLALTAKGWRVSLIDRDPVVALTAERRGAGHALIAREPDEPADVVVLAVPPRELGATLADAQKRRLGRAYTDVCSVKERPTTEAAELGCDMSSFVAGHPLAGREKSGPQAARADLFAGLPWVLCPDPDTAPEALTAVLALVRASGAEPVRLGRTEHDRATALVSHAPHVVSAAMAARLRPAEDDALRLAGRGVADVTRKAAAAPGLWTEILVGNALPVAGVLEDVAADLARTAAALRASAREGAPDAEREIHDLLRHGQEGRARMMAAGALGDLAGEER